MPVTIRTFSLKVIECRVPDDADFIQLPIHEILNNVFAASPDAPDRHVPVMDDVVPGKRCSFIDSVSPAPTGCPGVTFRFGSYIKGEQPMGLRADVAGAAFDLAPSQLTDPQTGTLREPVTTFQGLAYGRVCIVENARGSGGINALQNCLTALVRRHINPKHPHIFLVDVGTREISAAIDRAGGTQELIMDVSRTREDPTHLFGRTLKDARGKIGGTDLVRVHFKAGDEGTLSKDDVLKAYEDLEADEVDRLILVLRGGAKFVGTEKCKVRKQISFPNDPNAISVQRAMADYLLELQEVNNGVSVLTPDGGLA